MIEKKRVAIYKSDGIFVRLEFGFSNEKEFEESLKHFAAKLNKNVEDIIVYTLGDRDETEEGYMYFCPRCGMYEEMGHEPDTRMYYRQTKEAEKLKAAGFYKQVGIECFNCEETFHIHTDKFDEEAEEMTKNLLNGTISE